MAQETTGWVGMGHNTAKGIIDEELYPWCGRERLDNNYVTIGSTTTEGNFTLYNDTGDKIITNPIPQDVNSFNYTLGKVPYKMFLLDNRHLKGPADKWVKAKRPLLSIGHDSYRTTRHTLISHCLSNLILFFTFENKSISY